MMHFPMVTAAMILGPGLFQCLNAQTQTLAEALAAGIPPEKRGVPPGPVEPGIREDKPSWRYAACASAELPDSLVIVNSHTLHVPVLTWQYESHDSTRIIWLPLQFQAPWRKNDTLRARVAGLNCGKDWEFESGPALLLEHDSLYFSLSTLHLVDSYLADRPDLYQKRLAVLVSRPDGTLLEPAVIRENPVGVMGLAVAIARNRREEAARDSAHTAEVRAKRWPSRITKAVLAGNVKVGMTAEMVRLSWGDPETVNRTVTAQGASEQWVYADGDYLYLTNGRVTAVQTSGKLGD